MNVDKMRIALSAMFVYHVAFIHALLTTGSFGKSLTRAQYTVILMPQSSRPKLK